MQRDLLSEFSDFGADYFLAIFWLDYDEKRRYLQRRLRFPAKKMPYSIVLYRVWYVEICGEGLLEGLYVGRKSDPTWTGEKLCLNFFEFGADYFLTIF